MHARAACRCLQSHGTPWCWPWPVAGGRSSLLGDTDARRDAELVKEVSARIVSWAHERLCDAYANFEEQPHALAVSATPRPACLPALMFMFGCVPLAAPAPFIRSSAPRPAHCTLPCTPQRRLGRVRCGCRAWHVHDGMLALMTVCCACAPAMRGCCAVQGLLDVLVFACRSRGDSATQLSGMLAEAVSAPTRPCQGPGARLCLRVMPGSGRLQPPVGLAA